MKEPVCTGKAGHDQQKCGKITQCNLSLSKEKEGDNTGDKVNKNFPFLPGSYAVRRCLRVNDLLFVIGQKLLQPHLPSSVRFIHSFTVFILPCSLCWLSSFTNRSFVLSHISIRWTSMKWKPVEFSISPTSVGISFGFCSAFDDHHPCLLVGYSCVTAPGWRWWRNFWLR